MNLLKRKILTLKTSTWFDAADNMYYVRRLPGVPDLLLIQQAYPFKQDVRAIAASDFIFWHPTNRLRERAATFFFSLEWRDDLCIRSAIENDLIRDIPAEKDIRVVCGEVWTFTDWEIDRAANPNNDRPPFESFPELPYGTIALPPYGEYSQLLASPASAIFPNIGN